MVKMRRADYHPLEIVVKAAFILLIVGETNGKPMQSLEDSTLEKFLSIIRPSIHSSYDPDRPNPPIWYYPPFSHRIQPEKDYMQKDRIYYPDEFVQFRSLVENPPKCDGTTYCENTPYYPTEDMDRLLLKDENVRNLAVVDTLVTDSVVVGQRIGTEDESPLCASTEQLIYPTTAESAHGDGWLWVAQSKKLNFTQRVRVENCKQINAKCDIIGNSLPLTYVSHCTQKYVVRDLIVTTKNGTSLSSAPLRFPSSCCCGVTLTGRRKRSLKTKKTDDTI